MSKFADLVGTLTGFFRIGLTGVRLENNAGNLRVRNSAGNADAQVTTSQLNNSGDSIVVGTTNTLTVSRNSTAAANYTLVAPPGKSTDGWYLRQKAGTGAGVVELEFAAVAGSSDKIATDTTSLAFGATSPVALFTLPANAVVQEVRVNVDTAFNGSPSLSIGVAGTTSKYVASNQIDLTMAAMSFAIYPALAANGSSENLIATYAAGGATAGAARIEVDYVIPA